MSDFLTIAASLADADPVADLPVESWDPAHCGQMDLIIRQDGTWVHEGTPIGRPQLVRLFSRVLRKDPEGYVLVTPAEKISIQVEDVPFLAVDADEVDGTILVRTNVGDRVAVGADHPLTMGTTPRGDAVAYVRVRGGLNARFSRPAWYRLIEMAELCGDRLVIRSDGHSFGLGCVDD